MIRERGPAPAGAVRRAPRSCLVIPPDCAGTARRSARRSGAAGRWKFQLRTLPAAACPAGPRRG